MQSPQLALHARQELPLDPALVAQAGTGAPALGSSHGFAHLPASAASRALHGASDWPSTARWLRWALRPTSDTLGHQDIATLSPLEVARSRGSPAGSWRAGKGSACFSSLLRRGGWGRGHAHAHCRSRLHPATLPVRS